MDNAAKTSLTINELQEFANFSPCEQRYIKRSLDVGLGRRNAYKLWARNAAERESIRHQYDMYQQLGCLRASLPEEFGFDSLEPYMGKLVSLTAFDLAQGRLSGFSSYRFLYERLLGADARPWLPAAFCAAAALPQISPTRRKGLLQSLSEAAATAPGWSTRQPSFYPEWVEQEAA